MSWKDFKKYVDRNNTNYQFIYYDSREPNKDKRVGVVRATEYKELTLQK